MAKNKQIYKNTESNITNEILVNIPLEKTSEKKGTDIDTLPKTIDPTFLTSQCLDCLYWSPCNSSEVGACRVDPPSVNTLKCYADGALHSYRLTLKTLPACSKFKIK